MLELIWRYGAFVAAPAVAARERPPPEQNRDELWLGLFYLATTSVVPLAESFAGASAMGSFGGYLMVLNTLGRVLLPFIITVVLCEVLLGRGRARGRGVCMVWFVTVALVARGCALAGMAWPGPGYLPEAVGAVLAAAVALTIRRHLAPTQVEP